MRRFVDGRDASVRRRARRLLAVVRWVVGLALWALAARWAALAARELLTRTPTPGPRPPRPDGRLRAGERCPDCYHKSTDHDPDLGCLRTIAGDGGPEDCPCRRLGCTCPGRLEPSDPPGAR